MLSDSNEGNCFMLKCRFGIRCNAVLPGLIETPMIADVPRDTAQMVGPDVTVITTI